MNRFFTLLIFVLITNGPVLAQKSSIIKIALRTDLTVSPKGRLFTIDSVVDVRIDTMSRFGTWQYPTGKTVELHTKEGFQPSLMNFTVTSLPNTDNKLPSYTLLIQEFSLNGMPQTTRFELAVTFCKHTVDYSKSVNRQLVPAYKANIIVDNSNAVIIDVLKQGLAIAFSKFNQYLADPTAIPSTYNDFAIEAAKTIQDLNLTQSVYDSTKTDEDNLLRCSQFRQGIYQSFSELRQNRPSLTGQLVVQEKNGFANLRKYSGSVDRHQFFGFCDGKDVFISLRLYQSSGLIRRYAKVKSIGRYLLWIDDYITSGQTAGASFGLVGALATSYRDCIALDMQTGGVFMVTKDKSLEMLAGHDDLLAEFLAMPNQKDEQQQFLLLDKLNQRSRSTDTR